MWDINEVQQKLSTTICYTLAVAIFLVALFLRLWLAPANFSFPFVTFYPAMVIVVYLCGIRPGVLVVLLSATAGYYIFLTKFGSVNVSQEGIVAILTFLFSAYLIGMIVKQLQSFANQSREIFMNSPTAMVAVDTENGRIVQANNVALNMFGYSIKEMLSKTISDLTFPDNLAETQQRNEQLAQGLVNNLCFEKRYIRKDGSCFLAQSSVSTLKNASGKVVCFIESSIDITELKATEESLRKSEENYRSLFENLLEGYAHCKMLYEHDIPQDFIYLDVNRNFEELTGLKDVEGKKVSEIIPGIRESNRELFEVYGRVALSGQPEKLETYVDELGIWFSVAIYSPSREHFVAVFDNITTRKQADIELRQERDRNQMYLDTVQTFMVALDAEGRISMINRGGCEMLGYQESELLGRNWFTTCLPQPEGIDVVYPMFLNIMRGDFSSDEYHENSVRCNDGTSRLIAWRNTYIVDDAGHNIGILSSGQDITERKKMDDALHQAATVFESSHDGAIITDLTGRILAVNHAYLEITGYSEVEFLGQNPRILNSGRQSRDFYQSMWASINEAGYWQGEVWNRRKSGELYPERLTISAVKNAQNETTHYVGMSSDLSQLKQSETQREHLAHYDPLTDLPNRLLVQAHLTHALVQARRYKRQLAVLYLDLDRFKNINDSLGYPVGDELLIALTKRLVSCARIEDMLARLGGDEFLLVMEHLEGPDGAARVAQSLLELLTQPFLLSGEQEVFVGVSIGISVSPNDGSGSNQLIQHAEAAMHQAKKQGRNTYRFYTDSLTRAAGEHFELETRLRHAIPANQLRVYYQPQVDIATGHIIGAEALVRWLDPERGLIPPVHFIPLAEETGLINAIGECVLRETCLQGVKWIAAGLPFLTLAVNISPHQFMRSNIAELVSKVLTETGFPADRLEIELTESALMEQKEEAVKMLHMLRAQNIRLAIDDFGTGYSSLSYLKRFPLDILKIDKSFVDDIPYHHDDMEIAATIISMGHILGFKVLAEGVETIEQLNFLQSKGCDMYQGYFTSPALPAEEFERLIKRK